MALRADKQIATEGFGEHIRLPFGPPPCKRCIAADRELKVHALAVRHECRALGRAVAAALEELGQTG